MRLRGYSKLLVFYAFLCLLPACKGKAAKAPEEDAIKEVIVRFDKALIESYRRLNTDPLNEVASDKEIGKNDSIMLNFSKNNIYMESEFKDIKFLEFKRISNTKVDVNVWEKWRWRHLNSKTKEVVKPWVEEEYKILYHMVKDKKKGWIVESLKLE